MHSKPRPTPRSQTGHLSATAAVNSTTCTHRQRLLSHPAPRDNEQIIRTNSVAHFFLPLDLPFEFELVETTLDAREGAAELPLDLTLSRALFYSLVSHAISTCNNRLGTCLGTVGFRLLLRWGSNDAILVVLFVF